MSMSNGKMTSFVFTARANDTLRKARGTRNNLLQRIRLQEDMIQKLEEELAVARIGIAPNDVQKVSNDVDTQQINKLNDTLETAHTSDTEDEDSVQHDEVLCQQLDDSVDTSVDAPNKQDVVGKDTHPSLYQLALQTSATIAGVTRPSAQTVHYATNESDSSDALIGTIVEQPFDDGFHSISLQIEGTGSTFVGLVADEDTKTQILNGCTDIQDLATAKEFYEYESTANHVLTIHVDAAKRSADVFVVNDNLEEDKNEMHPPKIEAVHTISDIAEVPMWLAVGVKRDNARTIRVLPCTRFDAN